MRDIVTLARYPPIAIRWSTRTGASLRDIKVPSSAWSLNLTAFVTEVKSEAAAPVVVGWSLAPSSDHSAPRAAMIRKALWQPCFSSSPSSLSHAGALPRSKEGPLSADGTIATTINVKRCPRRERSSEFVFRVRPR
jgi:hypothetical protein